MADYLAVAPDDNADGVLIAVRGVGRAEAYAVKRNFNAGVKEHIVLCPCIARAERGEHVHRSQHRNGAVRCEQPVERAEVGVVVVDMCENHNVYVASKKLILHRDFAAVALTFFISERIGKIGVDHNDRAVIRDQTEARLTEPAYLHIQFLALSYILSNMLCVKYKTHCLGYNGHPLGCPL